MRTTRRDFVKAVGVGAVGATLLRPSAGKGAPAVSTGKPYDVAVVGSGVFGAWTAHRLRQAGKRVALLDAYGPGNARSSSGGQTRVIRMSYGAQDIYTRWSMRSLELWKSTFGKLGRAFFAPIGVLWMARTEDPLTMASLATLQKLGVRHERLQRSELERRWPQIDFGPITWAIHEPGSGVLMAFHAVQAVVNIAIGMGVDYLQEQVVPPEGEGRLSAVSTRTGKTVSAGTYVFACGPWLPKVFPDVLGDRIFPTRQEVFYFGPPPGDERFRAEAMPVWADFGEEIYGIPDLKGRGFKVAPDARDAGGSPGLRGPALSRPEGRTGRRQRGLPVREHVQWRLPDRPAPRTRQRLAGGRRVGPRLQARARGRRIRRRARPRGRRSRETLQPGDEGEDPEARGLLKAYSVTTN
jgi:sarcosine oxidase